jgi:hypothetical protein
MLGCQVTSASQAHLLPLLGPFGPDVHPHDVVRVEQQSHRLNAPLQRLPGSKQRPVNERKGRPGVVAAT